MSGYILLHKALEVSLNSGSTTRWPVLDYGQFLIWEETFWYTNAEMEPKSGVSTSQILLSGFLGIIALGTVLLLLPYSTTNGISFIDALFTATSAVCVTGLIVKNTGTDFTLFGQFVILILIQIGGLGYMSLSTMMALIAGRKIGLFERFMIKESMNIDTFAGVVRFMKRVLVFVFLTETVGALILAGFFMKDMSPEQAILYGIFHSVSAFNNAGFSLFPDSFIRYRAAIIPNITLMSLIVLGGLGFVVVDDIYERLLHRRKKLIMHTKLVLTSTVLLLILGTVVIFLTERHHLFSTLTTKESILASLFGSVTARTAGFNTVDYSLLQSHTLFFTIILMLIGASPGSTGGGIKTTTFSVVILNIWATLKGKEQTVAFKRAVSPLLVSRALVILALAVFYVTTITFVIIDIERSQFLPTLFEVVSAFGTVGLSVGNGGTLSYSANFSYFSKFIIIVTMLTGRLGPLTLFTALVKQKVETIKYPEGRLMIG